MSELQTLHSLADAIPTLATVGKIDSIGGAIGRNVGISEPSADAMDIASFYYKGLPSCPRLVYRTGRTPWEGPSQLKEIRPVHNHDLNRLWNDLGSRLCQLLDSQHVLWSTIDVVRFVEGDSKPPGPPTIWIGVLPNTLRNKDARLSAHGCLALLDSFGVTDVEIEYRESVYARLNNRHLYKHVADDPIADVKSPLTPTLGLSIAALATPYIEGTGGLYLAEGGDSKKVLLLTARHVLFPKDTPNTNYSSVSSPSSIKVILLGTRSFDDLTETITKELGRNKDTDTIQQFQTLLKRTNTGNEEEWNVALHRMGEKAGLLETLLAEVKHGWSSPEYRVIGHVTHAPPIVLGAGTEGFTNDYAIVELDASRFKEASLENVIDLGAQLPRDEFEKKMRPWDDEAVDASRCFSYPQNGLLQVQNIIPEDDLRKPKMRDRNGDPCLLVIKNGKTTGVTIGRATGIFSYTREYFSNDTRRTSREWAILPYDKNSGVFSDAGDSGSIIVDGFGQIGGLLTGGSSKPLMARTDITYATPFYWLLQQIKQNAYPNAHPL